MSMRNDSRRACGPGFGADTLILYCLLAAACIRLDPALADDTAASYNWSNVRIVGGAYVPGIIVNESEPGLAYARTDIGGACRWDAAADRWIPLLYWVGLDDWDLTSVDSIATDPVDPNRVYVLGGSYTNSFDPHNGAMSTRAHFRTLGPG